MGWLHCQRIQKKVQHKRMDGSPMEKVRNKRSNLGAAKADNPIETGMK